MKTKELNKRTEIPKSLQTHKSNLQTILSIVFGSLLMLFAALPASAHCDSYDGPVIKDAEKALEENNVDLVLKWINQEQEAEIISLFRKTYNLESGDKEVYEIILTHWRLFMTSLNMVAGMQGIRTNRVI